MDIQNRNRSVEREEIRREAEEARSRKQQAILEYIAACDYPEVFEEEEEENE